MFFPHSRNHKSRRSEKKNTEKGYYFIRKLKGSNRVVFFFYLTSIHSRTRFQYSIQGSVNWGSDAATSTVIGNPLLFLLLRILLFHSHSCYSYVFYYLYYLQSLAQLGISMSTWSASVFTESTWFLSHDNWTQGWRKSNPDISECLLNARKTAHVFSFHLHFTPKKQILSSSFCRWESKSSITVDRGHTISGKKKCVQWKVPFQSPGPFQLESCPNFPRLNLQPSAFTHFLVIINKTPILMTKSHTDKSAA